MLSSIRLAIVSPIIAAAIVGCGSEPVKRLSHHQPTTDIAAMAEAPKMLIARVARKDLDSTAAKIDFVAINHAIKITSGADAERAFNEGEPISFGDAQKAKSMSLASGNASRFSLNYVPQQDAPIQCPPGMNCTAEQISVIAGQETGGGIFGGGIFQGFFTRIRNLLSMLNPFKWFGNSGGVSYGYDNQYGNGNNQYSTYPQIPPQQIPQQPVYQPVPVQYQSGYPMPQNPQYPQEQYPQPQYPQTQYPQTQPGNQYPQMPQGTEPMPTQLNAN